MDDALQERFDAWLADTAAASDRLTPDGVRIDAHTHLGVDAGSGLEMTVDALEQQLDLAGIDRAVVIPLNASDGYHRVSLRLAERAAISRGRFSSLYRIDQRDPRLREHVELGLDAGAVGLKLHPASDGCTPAGPAATPALEVAEARRAIVLVHTGIDVAHAATDTVEAARRHPGARFVLGHVPAESLGATLSAIAQLDNVWVCLVVGRARRRLRNSGDRSVATDLRIGPAVRARRHGVRADGSCRSSTRHGRRRGSRGRRRQRAAAARSGGGADAADRRS